MVMKKNRVVLLALSLVIGLSSRALAKDESGSLDSMWIDQSAAPATQAIDESKPVASDPEPPAQVVHAAPAKSKKSKPEQVSSSDTVTTATVPVGAISASHAPLCTWADFKSSSFLSKGAWPGVGPFTPSDADSSDLSDSGQNRLKLDVSSDQVNNAQLYLAKTAVRDFLDIEMSSDFLLEALGVKAKKIVEFNTALEKNKDGLMRGKGISLTIGHYQISLDRSHTVSPYACLIAINSLEANRNVLNEHSISESPADPNKPVDKTIVAAANESKTKTNTGDAKRNNPKTNTSKPNPSGDTKREEFIQAIKNWQAIKKVAVSKRDTTHLSEILGGRALARQSDAIKWLTTNKKYYDMVPKGVSVEKYQELAPGKKYAVMASVREFSKLIDDGSGQVLKEVDDKYTVNYTLEKTGDHWSITDSQLLSTTPAGQASKSAAATPKTSH